LLVRALSCNFLERLCFLKRHSVRVCCRGDDDFQISLCVLGLSLQCASHSVPRHLARSLGLSLQCASSSPRSLACKTIVIPSPRSLVKRQRSYDRVSSASPHSLARSLRCLQLDSYIKKIAPDSTPGGRVKEAYRELDVLPFYYDWRAVLVPEPPSGPVPDTDPTPELGVGHSSRNLAGRSNMINDAGSTVVETIAPDTVPVCHCSLAPVPLSLCICPCAHVPVRPLRCQRGSVRPRQTTSMCARFVRPIWPLSPNLGQSA
jgi:hypothetical protein